MSRYALLGLVACLAIGLICAGCDTMTPPQQQPTADPSEVKYVFRIDFANNTVTSVPAGEVNTKMVDTDPGDPAAEIELTMTVATEETGAQGRRHVDAVVSNNSSGSIGVNREGTVTGVDLCVDRLKFEKSNGSTVAGGGMAGAHAWNPNTELPIYLSLIHI